MKRVKKHPRNKTSSKTKKQELCFGEKLAVIFICASMLCDLMFPKLALAKEPVVIAEEPEAICITVPREIYCDIKNGETIELPSLTPSKDVPIKTFWVYVTAYSSTPDQTDDTPFITAMGTRVHDGLVATNILPFKTRIKFPNDFGDKWFVVEDRMNRRYNNSKRMDIWMSTRQEAINFGAQWLEAEIY